MKFPWQRSAHLGWLDQVCACPLRMVVSEFHPVSVADKTRKDWEPEMNGWLNRYLALQPDCTCTPLLRLGTVIGEQGRPIQLLAVIYHDADICPNRAEPIETQVK